MAVVEDEVKNESEEENEIEVVVEEDDLDSEDSDHDGFSPDDIGDEELLESRAAGLEQQIAEDPYNYDVHIALIKTLWNLSSLDRWRAAFERLHQISPIQPEHWLNWLKTEESLAHTHQACEKLGQLYREATAECFSTSILRHWSAWVVTLEDPEMARKELDEVLRRGGADPVSGKIYWDAKLEWEKHQLVSMRKDNPDYKKQQERVLWCLEEIVSRPLPRAEAAMPQFEELALVLHDQQYVDKVKKQHKIAMELLKQLTEYEDKLLVCEENEDRLHLYESYILTLQELSQDDRYAECDCNGILRVIYDRATTECPNNLELLQSYARHSSKASNNTYERVLQACAARCTRKAIFWALNMERAEQENEPFDKVKSIFETALSKGMESYQQAESLWMSYLTYIRRSTKVDNETDVERLRRTFRLAWDSLAETWGDEANDCEVPIYWARLEYKILKDPKQGKEIFEEIFKYGDNKTMSKYWEAFIGLECSREPRPSDHKLRELMRRAIRAVTDYPPAITRLWTDFERDYGQVNTLRECLDYCETKVKTWRESYHALKDKMMGKKQNKGQNKHDKKNKQDRTGQDKRKDKLKDKGKGKRKAEGSDDSVTVKRKKDDMEVDQKDDDSTSAGVKRSHDEDDEHVAENKRQRTDSNSPHRLGTRDACTLFVSNLEFKVNEQNLRDKLSQYGDIISLRVRKGIKAFGGSICYCQYKTPESVDEALKRDRTPLDGRPMFFSRYSAKKSKPTFKYSTEAEKNKLFVKNLPFAHCTKDALSKIFDKYGKLKDIRVVTHKDGKPKGLAYVEYEDETSAAEAVSKANGLVIDDRKLDVALSAPPPRQATPSDILSLGQPKRDATGGMRRTQLSSFIPSVLQKPSTSTARSDSTPQANGSHSNGNHDNGDNTRPLSNSDFRNMLLKK